VGVKAENRGIRGSGLVSRLVNAWSGPASKLAEHLDLHRHLGTETFAHGVAGELLDEALRYLIRTDFRGWPGTSGRGATKIRSVCAALVNDAASAGQF